MKKTWLIAGLCLLAAVPARADVYTKSKMMQMGDSETWVSGKKQRIEMNVPIMGKNIIITRADKGVEWTLNSSLKIYEEKPIAIDYAKTKKFENDVMNNSSSMTPMSKMDETEADDCKPEMRTSGGRQFLGTPATRYEMGCAGKSDGAWAFWMVPLKGEFAKAYKEMEEFGKAHSAAMYAQYPANERKEMQEGLQMLGSMMSVPFTGGQGLKSMPKGFPVAMEQPKGVDENGQAQGNLLMYEMTTLSTAPVDPTLFEVPQGFHKVENVALEQARQMVGPQNYDSTMQSLKDIQSAQGDEQAAEAMGKAMGNALNTMESPEMQRLAKNAAAQAEAMSGQSAESDPDLEPPQQE